MYALPAYVTVDPQPGPIMYSLPSYHRNGNGSGEAPIQNGLPNGTPHLEIVDPVVVLEKRQQELISSLTALGDKLNTLLQQKGSKQQKAAPAEKKDKKAAATPAAAAAPAPAEGGKKDKDAKKEARKAAKQEAKAKVATGDAPKGKPVKNANANNGWIIHEEKRSTETGQSLTACTKPELASFAQQAIGDVTLIVTTADLPWVNALAKIAEKRHVVFSGAVANKAGKGKTSVTVAEGEKFELKVKEGAVASRVASWKLLGAALGLYSYEANQTIQAAHQHQWLARIERVILKEADVDFVLREASQFLSRFDTLGSQFNVGVADILLRSLLLSHSQPNNIELWTNRVDTLL